jgi:subfamily B ATP-binding cassette protein HlyB/CyaB
MQRDARLHFQQTRKGQHFQGGRMSVVRQRWRVRANQVNDSESLRQELPQPQWLWALGSLCTLHGLSFSAELLAREYPPPCTHGDLLQAARQLGLRIEATRLPSSSKSPNADEFMELGKLLRRLPMPLLVDVRTSGAATPDGASAEPQLAILTSCSETTGEFSGLQFLLFDALTNTPRSYSLEELSLRLAGQAWLAKPQISAPSDPDALASGGAANESQTNRLVPFGFRWFVPALLKHSRVWRDVLLASLALQVITLATPLFTQAIIDKVIVHRTQSTLVAIGIAMVLFTIFTSLLTWVRQYLVLHTGNRVDAVLGAEVWNHLLGLPLAYFQNRPTGVVAARMHGVETIREFISGAAISLVLDLPFLVICLGVMVWYSPLLSAVVVAMLAIICVASAIVSPLFQARLQKQFLLGARNQAFITEHIAGMETVKSLQMEPQLRKRYADYLATYLHSGFETKQIGNTYNVAASTGEQLMTLAVLMLGAWTVMTEPSFTIGMLVAFQMFSGKLSQPVMRIVGLWAQFQQARLAVDRLGDLMNVPAEPSSISPSRNSQPQGKGRIEVTNISFRYTDDLPLLYENLSLRINPGEVVAITGPSGCGKSTLAKLLLGFHQPTSGQIKIDGIDIRHLSANELRAAFGVVPQDVTLFSGTILDNLRSGNCSATLQQVSQAAKLAGVLETIEALPQGFQTHVGERGSGLSGGQKQRLSVARALLKSPTVLIFDEATSALDTRTAENLATTINSLRGKVTIILIAHALPANLQIDRTIFLGV